MVSDELQEDDYGLRKRLLRPRTALSFLIGAGIVLLAMSRLDLNWGDIYSQLRNANVGYVLLAFAAYYGSIFVRSVRWSNLLDSAEVRPDPGFEMPGTRGMAAIYMVSWYFNCLLPAKLGDAYRGYLLKSRSRTPYSTALGTVVAERIADVVALATLLVITGFLVFGTRVPATLANWLILAAALGLAFVIGFILLFRYREYLRKLVPERAMTHYLRLEQGILMSYKKVPSLVGLTGTIWVLEGVRMYCIGLAIGAGLGIPEAVFIALLASLLTAVPATPAGLGFVELGIVGAAVVMGFSDSVAASLAVLDRFVAYWSVLVIGTVVFLITRWKWRGKQLANSPGLHSGN
ncbi:MAG: lysylphosphatidylglycerol synthase transmembrane domain-containing protein [Thermomicrobiaceae bacterium]